MRIKVALVALAAVFAATGAACTHDPDPSPPPTASPTAVPSATPAPPPLPPAAQADSPTGAEAFARYWLTTLDYAYQTGNTKPFRQLGTCKGCIALADAIDQVYREGGRFEGGLLTTMSATASAYSASRSASVSLRYSRTPRKTIHGDGQVFDSAGSSNLGFLIKLARSNGWTVTAFPTIK